MSRPLLGSYIHQESIQINVKIIQTCFVVSGSKVFYSTFVVVFKSVLQKQCRFYKNAVSS